MVAKRRDNLLIMGELLKNIKDNPDSSFTNIIAKTNITHVIGVYLTKKLLLKDYLVYITKDSKLKFNVTNKGYIFMKSIISLYGEYDIIIKEKK